MRKITRTLLSVVCVLVCTFSLFFAGCGATPMNAVKSIRFVSEKYEVGTDGIKYAVFEADLNQWLDIKVSLTPSSWSGYDIHLLDHNSTDGDRGFTRNEFRILITDAAKYTRTLPASFKVTLDGENFEYCKVYLKEYPTDIGLLNQTGDDIDKNPTIYLPVGGSLKLEPYGIFKTEGMQRILEEEYNYEISSIDSTIVKVENSKTFTISATKKTAGKTKVVFKVKDMSGNDIVLKDDLGNEKRDEQGNLMYLQFDIDVFVVENADSGNSFTYIEGADKFLKDNSAVTLHKTDFALEGDYYIIPYTNYLFSRNGNYVFDDNATVTCNNDNVIVDGDAKIILLNKNYAGGTLNFIVWCQSSNGSSNSYSFKIIIN